MSLGMQYDPSNPLIVQGDRTVLVEVDNARYAEARDSLAPFAELEKSPEHIHTYRLSDLSLWNAAAAGLTADDMIESIADEIVAERVAAGKPVNWKPGMNAEDASSQADYPPDIWQEATARWNGEPPEQRETELAEQREQMAAMQKMLQGMMRNEAFKASFSLFDILWVVLAAGSAFRLGSGATTDE